MRRLHTPPAPLLRYSCRHKAANEVNSPPARHCAIFRRACIHLRVVVVRMCAQDGKQSLPKGISWSSVTNLKSSHLDATWRQAAPSTWKCSRDVGLWAMKLSRYHTARNGDRGQRRNTCRPTPTDRSPVHREQQTRTRKQAIDGTNAAQSHMCSGRCQVRRAGMFGALMLDGRKRARGGVIDVLCRINAPRRLPQASQRASLCGRAEYLAGLRACPSLANCSTRTHTAIKSHSHQSPRLATKKATNQPSIRETSNKVGTRDNALSTLLPSRKIDKKLSEGSGGGQ